MPARPLLVTTTGEPFQPARLHYTVRDCRRLGILLARAGMCGLRQGPESLGMAFRRRSQFAQVQAFLEGRVEARSGGPRFFLYPRVPLGGTVRTIHRTGTDGSDVFR